MTVEHERFDTHQGVEEWLETASPGDLAGALEGMADLLREGAEGPERLAYVFWVLQQVTSRLHVILGGL